MCGIFLCYLYFVLKRTERNLIKIKEIVMETIKENKTPKIYIADNTEDNSIVDYFKRSENFEFVGASSDGAKVVDDVLSLKPDVLVLEVMLSNLVGFAV